MKEKHRRVGEALRAMYELKHAQAEEASAIVRYHAEGGVEAYANLTGARRAVATFSAVWWKAFERLRADEITAYDAAIQAGVWVLQQEAASCTPST